MTRSKLLKKTRNKNQIISEISNRNKKYMEKILIIGGVAAGATAAAKVRRISPTARIVMLEAGPDISFANCGLPYFIGGDIKSRSKLILQSPGSFNEQYGVEVHVNT